MIWILAAWAAASVFWTVWYWGMVFVHRSEQELMQRLRTEAEQAYVPPPI